MPFVHRNEGGAITGLSRWPSGSNEFLPDDDWEVVEFTTPVPKPDPEVALHGAIASASTLEELKAALLGQAGPGKVAGKPT